MIGSAFGVELRKTLQARVPIVTAVLLVLGVVAISVSVTEALAAGNPEVIAKLGPIVGAGAWPGYLDAALQVTAAASAGACGILISWSFGREFSDKTIAGLFALPVSRWEIATAKLLTFLLWSFCSSLALAILLPVGGLAAGLGWPDGNTLDVLLRLPVLLVTTAGMTIPGAWVATLSRSLLGGIAVTVVLLASAQVVVFSGGGSWYPPSAPALWAIDPSRPHTATLLLAQVVPLVAILLTIDSWRRLQLDR